MNLFQILSADYCTDELSTLIYAVKFIFTLIQWAIPCVLIVLGTIDMFKAMTSGKDDEVKKVRKVFINRLIYAVVAFLVPFILSLVFSFVGKVFAGSDEAATAGSTFKSFMSCWSQSSAGTSTDDDERVNCVYPNGNVQYDVKKSDCQSAGGTVVNRS